MTKNLSFITIFLAFSASALLFSCTKDEVENSSTGCVGGPNGNVELSVYVYHYDSLVPGASVYIKYNTMQSPGYDVSLYDTVKVCGVTGHGRGHAHIKHMRCGNYFLFAAGYDSNATDSVFGGMTVSVSQDTGTVHIDIPVY